MEDKLWLAVGFTGQALFTSRMAVQWFVTEKKGRSVVPKAFWYLSLAGSLVLLAYALYRMDPVFIAGQAFGFVVYIRNLMLWKDEPG